MGRRAWFGGSEGSLGGTGIGAFAEAAGASSSSAEAKSDVVGVVGVLPVLVVGGRVVRQALGGGAFLEACSMQLFGVLAAPSQWSLRGVRL